MVVTGHEAAKVRAALAGADFVDNPDYADGLSASLRAGLAELPDDTGARHLIGEHADQVCEVVVNDDAVLVDVDTPEALDAIS